MISVQHPILITHQKERESFTIHPASAARVRQEELTCLLIMLRKTKVLSENQEYSESLRVGVASAPGSSVDKVGHACIAQPCRISLRDPNALSARSTSLSSIQCRYCAHIPSPTDYSAGYSKPSFLQTDDSTLSSCPRQRQANVAAEVWLALPVC